MHRAPFVPRSLGRVLFGAALFGATLLGATRLAGCTGGDGAAPADGGTEAGAAPARIVLVVVDTLRRDRLGTYGYPRPTSPGLDAWAAEGAVFTQARAPAPWTLPSGRALLGADLVEAFDPENTVPVRLQAAGWSTRALLANHNLGPRVGFHAGWGDAELDPDASADAQVDRALGVLDAHAARADAAPLFLLLHLMDPHLPYREGPAHRGLFAGEPPTARMADPLREPVLKGDNAVRPLTEAELRYLGDRYDQNVHAVDAALARLLPRLGPEDLVVVTSDHGEALGEHGGIGHGHGLTEEQVAIPLLVRGPGWAPGRVDLPVGLDDVGATVLAAAGVPGPEGASGRDLRALVAAPGADRPQRLSHTHQGPARIGVVQGADKRVGTAEAVQRVDLAADPGEAAPALGPWSAEDRAAWEAAGGAPLRPVLRVRLAPPEAWRTGDAPSDVRAVALSHPAGVSRVWWPAAPLRTTAPQETRTAAGLVLGASEPRVLPAELWVEVPDGADPADLRVTVTKAGVEVPGSALPGFSVAAGWVPPEMPHVPLRGPGGEAGARLQALGYVEPAEAGP